MRMMCCSLMFSCLVVLGRFLVVARRVLVMFGRFAMTLLLS